MSDLKHIPVFRPDYDERELEALRPVLASGWIGLGPKTAEFEEKFAAYVGSAHAVAVNSATAALHMALLAAGIGEGDEVLVPSMSFVSTAHAVEYVGARPVFVDVEYDTLNLDVLDASRKITPRTKAIIPVHFGGHPANLDAVQMIADTHGLTVIEDAAHACGAAYLGKRIGGISDYTAFSFHAVKNLACGDGGMITTNDSEAADKMRRLRWLGINKSTHDRSGKAYSWEYDVSELGHKCHMNDIAAALGLVQLEKLERGNERRRQIASMYDVGLAGLSWVDRPVVKPYAHTAQHNYVIKAKYRDHLNYYLKERNIATGVHYKPIHLMSYYRNQLAGYLPETERVWTKLLTLPVYPAMTEGDVDRVIEGVTSFPGKIEEMVIAA